MTMRWEHMATTIEVSAGDVNGIEALTVLRDLGQHGWEPWHMFSTAASGAFRFPAASTDKIYLAIWLKRPARD
jgi:hypothetical protein